MDQSSLLHIRQITQQRTDSNVHVKTRCWSPRLDVQPRVSRTTPLPCARRSPSADSELFLQKKIKMSQIGRGFEQHLQQTLRPSHTSLHERTTARGDGTSSNRTSGSDERFEMQLYNCAPEAALVHDVPDAADPSISFENDHASGYFVGLNHWSFARSIWVPLAWACRLACCFLCEEREDCVLMNDWSK